MYILDELSDKSLKKVILYLTPIEAEELRDSLEDILKTPVNNHAHIPNDTYKKEITVCIYNKNDLVGFDKKSIDLIQSDDD